VRLFVDQPLIKSTYCAYTLTFKALSFLIITEWKKNLIKKQFLACSTTLKKTITTLLTMIPACLGSRKLRHYAIIPSQPYMEVVAVCKEQFFLRKNNDAW